MIEWTIADDRHAPRNVTNHVRRRCLLADVRAIVGSIDVVMGEVDR